MHAVELIVVQYVGEYKEGKRCGKGTLYTADGSIYEGSFVENQVRVRHQSGMD